ncbi:MAG: polyprenyl synthetase family protein, partial [Anaerolineales bacterium]
MPPAQLTPLCLAAIEDELRQVVGSGPPDLREYYAMLEYHLGWDADAHRQASGSQLASSGKRLRPLLCLLSCAAAGGEWERALPMAAGLELLHNFSLIHDDIQDGSPLRRGRPTVWRKWGQAQAINAGDALFTLAHLAPHGLPQRGLDPGLTLRALAMFDHTCLVLTQGQFLDMTFEQRPRVGVGEYLAMIEAKTAALIAASTGLGALLAGADEDRRAHFEQYGRSLGLAFQIQDDLLGIWGDPAVTGKSAANDLEKRKKSLPVVYGLEHSEDFARAYAGPHTPEASVLEMAQTLETLGARDYAQRLAATLTAEAGQHLDHASPHGVAGAELRALTEQL